MDKDVSESFESYFGGLKDSRIERHKLYPLTEILFVVLCGTICGAESWRDYVLFGKEKLNFLRQHFPFKNGIPSKNTMSRVFYALAPDAFKQCFIEWVKSLQRLLNDVIAIVRHIVVNILNNARKFFKNIGLKALRKKAGWGNETLKLILDQNF
jgi:hypothetical protein